MRRLLYRDDSRSGDEMSFRCTCNRFRRGTAYSLDQCRICWLQAHDPEYGGRTLPPRNALCVSIKVLAGNYPALDNALIRLALTQAVRLADFGLESFSPRDTAPAWVGEIDLPGRGRVPFGLICTGDRPADWHGAFDRRPQSGPTTGPQVPLLRRMNWASEDGAEQLRFVVTP
jgi:hypothetical protein